MRTAPRSPNRAELDAIADLCSGDRHNFEWQETREQLDAASVAVFAYISDSPGYVGRVAVVVWPGGPELFDVFTLDGKEPAAMPHDTTKTKEQTA
jgi:hypothetical protein